MSYQPRIYHAPNDPKKHEQFVYTSTVSSEGRQSNESSAKDSKPFIKNYFRWSQLYPTKSNPTWQPSWLQIRPLLGLLSILVAVASLLAALGVLLISDGQRVTSWPIQPTVYLAIAAAAGVSALRFAKAKATPIAWWHHAYQGSTVRSLEYHWEAGQNLFSAVAHFHNAKWVSMSTILYLLMIIDGAMLQRASTVKSMTVSQPVSLKVQLAPELPTGFSGIFRGNDQLTSPAITQVNEDFLNNVPMTLDVVGCDAGASCTTKVHGPGVAMSDCKPQTWPISAADIYNGNATWGPWHGPYGRFMLNPVFQIWLGSMFSDNSTARESGWLMTGVANWTASGGSYVASNCTLVPAILEYDVSISNGEISLVSPHGELVALANNTVRPSLYNSGESPCTIDILFSFAEVYTAANASAAFTLPPVPGDYWSLWPTSLDEVAAKYLDFASGDMSVQFSDPTQGVLSIMNQLLFRGGIMAGPWANTTHLMDEGLSPNQTVHGTQTLKENVFHSDLRWFAGAAVLDILAIASILPLFWGWWRLPRDASQSPFDMALAFNAPLLEDVHSTAGADGVVAQKGDLKVAFGLVRGETRSSIARAESGYMNTPLAGRLGIGYYERVTKPEKGIVFVR